MIKKSLSFSFTLILFLNISWSQNVPIIDYSTNNFGQVQLEINAQADKYYLLSALHQPNLNYETITSITPGVNGTMIITEPLAAYAESNYKITEHSITSPDDTDQDGRDDISEYNSMPTFAPLNYARQIPFIDGTVAINSRSVFEDLSVVSPNISWAPFLNDKEFVKFVIVNQDSDTPEIFFVNSNTHAIHANFIATLSTSSTDQISKGEIVYNPNEILPNGAIGSYSFNYTFGDAYNFEHTRKTFELLAKNIPWLNNNLQHFIGAGSETTYENNFKDDYIGSRIRVVLESEVFADIDYIPFNQEEGYGLFRHMQLDDNPGSRDVVLYDNLPNSLPRVGGIITSVVQTPLSHVNLRAIQDNLPNAYIKDPLSIDSIANLIGKYVYYKVEQDEYTLREATLEEVNDWYEDLRPTEAQIPLRDLSKTRILPLDDIQFNMSNAFGAKCTNVATMRTFGFPEVTIPNGFGVPFYFYDEFMKHNNFYAQAQSMIDDPDFKSDLEIRIDMLKEFRKDIKAADMPQWMLDSLQVMHDWFPAGSSVRCRSSTNNEDLPGFSGAGLYTSKTQHPIEGHISKSIKQVYASMWNFRAYDERDFYRVDHFVAAMGILCHPNFEDEESNGVGVSIDPIYQTANTFYLNTQIGESLITNPDEDAIPEEILLDQDPAEGFFVLRYSNLVATGELVMDSTYLDTMRNYLKVIHDEFAILYDVVGAAGFGMDIEYKVTVNNELIIKQARPWVSFWSEINATFDLGIVEITNPISSSSLGNAELISAKITNDGLEKMKDFNLSLKINNQLVETITINSEISAQSDADYQFTIPQDFSTIGDYNIETIVTHPSDAYDRNDTLKAVVSKLHLIEGGIEAQLVKVDCGDRVLANAVVTNYGESTFSNTEIEIVSNAMVVGTLDYGFSIPYQATVEIPVIITVNLQAIGNVISFNLLTLNGQQDAIMTNNSDSFMTDLDSDDELITLVINADDWPQETSWVIKDNITNTSIASGFLNAGDDIITEDICVDYSSCYSLIVYDSIGDGICCGYGLGDFSVLNSSGATLVSNDGAFSFQAEEIFCPNGLGCLFTAEVLIDRASDSTSTDGIITLNPSSGNGPYEYSIDGGISFFSDNVFENLPFGEYMVVIRDASMTCTYEEVIQLGESSSVTDISLNYIKVYPNPTKGNFVIELKEDNHSYEDIDIVIYNGLGRLIQSHTILNTSGETKTNISLEHFPSGTYFARCKSQDFEEYFKIIKI